MLMDLCRDTERDAARKGPKSDRETDMDRLFLGRITPGNGRTLWIKPTGVLGRKWASRCRGMRNEGKWDDKGRGRKADPVKGKKPRKT